MNRTWMLCSYLGMQVGLGSFSWAFWWAPSPSINMGTQWVLEQSGDIHLGPLGPKTLAFLEVGLSSPFWVNADRDCLDLCVNMTRAKASHFSTRLQSEGTPGDEKGAVEGEEVTSKSSLVAVETMKSKVNTRASLRLAARDTTDILTKAMSRKASRREGVGAVEERDRATRLSVRKILAKSRLCEVRLGDAQASTFKEFVCTRV